MTKVLCDYLIKDAIAQSCSDPVTPGLERTGVIINRQDINFGGITYNSTNANTIETLPLKTGKQGYAIYQPANNPFNGTNKAFAVGTNVNTFTKQVKFVVLEQNPDVSKKVIDGLANGDFVIVLENKYKSLTDASGANAFEVYGLENGLRQSEGTIALSGDDADGSYIVTMQEAKAPSYGIYLFKTDYDTTKALFDSLTTVTP